MLSWRTKLETFVCLKYMQSAWLNSSFGFSRKLSFPAPQLMTCFSLGSSSIVYSFWIKGVLLIGNRVDHFAIDATASGERTGERTGERAGERDGERDAERVRAGASACGGGGAPESGGHASDLGVPAGRTGEGAWANEGCSPGDVVWLSGAGTEASSAAFILFRGLKKSVYEREVDT